jgi:protein-tyrosine-phosphatase
LLSFVSSSNTRLSVLAEYVTNLFVEDHNIEHLECISRGVDSELINEGDPVDSLMAEQLGQFFKEIMENHESTMLRTEDVEDDTVVMCMNSEQVGKAKRIVGDKPIVIFINSYYKDGLVLDGKFSESMLWNVVEKMRDVLHEIFRSKISVGLSLRISGSEESRG